MIMPLKTPLYKLMIMPLKTPLYNTLIFYILYIQEGVVAVSYMLKWCVFFHKIKRIYKLKYDK